MKHCQNCNLEIRGEKTRCPLCNALLFGEASKSNYMQCTTLPKQKKTWISIVATASVVACVISLWLNSIFHESFWSLYVAGGISSGIVLLGNYIRNQKNLSNLIISASLLLIILCVIWDLSTGFNKWSINYVTPGSLLLAALALFVLGTVFKKNNDIYILKVTLNSSLILILLLCGLVDVPLPSYICIGTNITIFLTKFFFYQADFARELKRIMHI
ncbi:MAG: DUF6320 domain-containing protein [Anaerovoracaceae bacterium]